MTPLVVQLDDDDCDGQITAMDAADILVSTFSGGSWSSTGVLHALSVKNGALVELWTAPGVFPVGSLAGADLDGKNGNEIIACGPSGGSVIAFSAGGTMLWSANVGCYHPSIADLDGDGKPEVVVEGGILSGTTGQIKARYTTPPTGFFTVGDINGDKTPEIVFANRAYDKNGSLVADLSAKVPASEYSWVALIDMDLDGKPEIVTTHFTNDSIAVWHYDAGQPGRGTVIRSPFKADIQPGGSWPWSNGMGALTAGDFDGDGVPDAGFVGFRGYVVLSGAKIMNSALNTTLSDLSLWSKPTDEDSGSTGSAVFDFDGDGKVEVLYDDTQRVHIFSGATGEDVATPFCNTTGSQFEYPVVADVDADGQADLVLVANAFSNHPNAPATAPTYTCDGTIQSGVRVFGSASGSWVQTRPIWNQHAYHVTNVNDDGTIPKVESSNWQLKGLNNFRQNKQVGKELGAPDAVVSVLPNCGTPFGIRVVVRNIGSAPIPAGATIAVYREGTPSPKPLGTVTTKHSLFPLQSETLVLPMSGPDASDLSSGQAMAFAVVDEEKKLRECRTDNNQSAPTLVACGIPK
jgi:hypothetical protein